MALTHAQVVNINTRSLRILDIDAKIAEIDATGKYTVDGREDFTITNPQRIADISSDLVALRAQQVIAIETIVGP